MFEGASGFVAGDITQINHFGRPPHDTALEKLYSHVAVVALHFSKARVDAPKCHEETRDAVQKDISSWTEACSEGLAGTSASVEIKAAERILWLTGPAGTGKTAIMGTVADGLAKEGRLAATFYFSSIMGAGGTTSNLLFVTTLAYQLVVHPELKGRLAHLIISALQENPAVFDMNLKQQLEVFIIEPLRAAQGDPGPVSYSSTCILVDGVDECEGSGEGSFQRSRQDNQLEVLSLLLEAAKNPVFPFRIIIASRPETWIRGYLDEYGPGIIHEIFLDEKYSPDDDIRLYLKAKFSEKCRRSNINPAVWPPQGAIAKLVDNASGQFIYAATVLRWVDTPGASPQAQLDSVLNLKIQPETRANPLAMLDALYTSILKSASAPETTVLWLKGVDAIRQATNQRPLRPSAWTLDRLFESYEGQASGILRSLPSLLYTVKSNTDLASLKRLHDHPLPLGLASLQCEASYTFYHKSFIDYLHDDWRCGAVFPSPSDATAKAWVASRITQTFKCHGPEVPVPQPLAPVFRSCFLKIVVDLSKRGLMILDTSVLADCKPSLWFKVIAAHSTPAVLAANGGDEHFRSSRASIGEALQGIPHGHGVISSVTDSASNASLLLYYRTLKTTEQEGKVKTFER